MEVKQTRSVDLINIHDYPRARYNAYWEIRVDGADDVGYSWGVRLYDYNTHQVVDQVQGGTITRDEADTLAQQWVLNKMPEHQIGGVQ